MLLDELTNLGVRERLRSYKNNERTQKEKFPSLRIKTH